MATRMQQRRGTATQWTTANPILNAGEIGYETDTNQFKIGDGTNHWADLDYFIDETALNTTLGDYVETSLLGVANGVATLNASGKLESSQVPNIDELAQDAVDMALVAGTGISKTYNDNANTITIAVDTSVIATKAELAEVSQDSVNDAITAGTGITKSYDDSANTITLSVDTTTIQARVADVSDTEIGYLANVTSDIQTQLNAKASSTDLSNHESDTTNIHGIANTAAIVFTTDTGTVTGTMIANETITNSDIANTAAIAQSKINGLTTDLAAKAALAGATFTGNVVVEQNFQVDGNFTVNGTNVLVSATQIQIEDSILQLAHQNANNLVDLGLVASYNDGTQKHAGLVKDTSDSKWKLFKDVTDEPSTTVNFSQGSLDALAVGALEATSLTVGDVSNTEFGYLANVTSDIQTQINNKISSSSTDTLTNKTINGSNNTLTVRLENDVTGTLPVANGGTGATTSSSAAAALLPTQSGNSGKYLTTDGSNNLSWGTVTGYSAPTLGSTLIPSGQTIATVSGLSLTNPTITAPLIVDNGAVVNNGTYTSGSGYTTWNYYGQTGFTPLSASYNPSTNVVTMTYSAASWQNPAELYLANVNGPTGTGLSWLSGNGVTNRGLAGVTTTTGSGTKTVSISLNSYSSAINVTNINNIAILVIISGPLWNKPFVYNYTTGTASVSSEEIAYLDGVTLPIQTQLNNRITASSTNTLTNKTINGSNNTLTVRLANDVTGTLPVANGGTGATTQAQAANAVLPSQATNSGKYLTTDGSNVSWGTVAGYSAPTIGSTSIASGAAVSSIESLTLSNPTVTVGFPEAFFAFGSTSGARSTDGVTWTQTSLPVELNPYNCFGTYGNGKFVISDDGYGIAGQRVYYSDATGSSWTGVDLPAAAFGSNPRTMAYGAGKFIIASYTSAGSAGGAQSTDGITWTALTLPGVDSVAEYKNWERIAFLNNMFILTSGDSAQNLAYSTNGTTWTYSTHPFTITAISEMAYGAGAYVIGKTADVSNIARSTDLITWTTHTAGNGSASTYLKDIIFQNGSFYAPDSYYSKLYKSTDGITWTTTTLPAAEYWGGIRYGAGKFVITVNSGYADKERTSVTSTDGTTWTLNATALPDTDQGVRNLLFGGTGQSTISSTEIGYVDGVTSAIQTQIDAKAGLASPTFTGTINAANLTLSGDLTVNGTTTTINSTTLSVDDKNIELGSVTSPTNTTADGGGITLKGATDKTFNWVNATSSWTSSEHINLASGKEYMANGTALKDVSETLTNKTINGSNNTLTVRLANDVSGTLPVANGGTGVTTSTGTGNVVLSAAPTLTGTVTASGDINLSAVNGPGSLIDELNLLMMGAL